jgi:hypothetical protein
MGMPQDRRHSDADGEHCVRCLDSSHVLDVVAAPVQPNELHARGMFIVITDSVKYGAWVRETEQAAT